MGNASGASQYGYGGQMGAMQQQQQMMMLQNRYRAMQSQSGLANGNMQQQRLRDGSCGGQGSSGQATGAGQMMQNRQRGGQSGNGNCPNR